VHELLSLFNDENVIKLGGVWGVFYDTLSRLIWWEELIEAGRLVRVKLIHHNPDAVRIRVVNICEFNHPVNPLCRPSPFDHFDGYPPG
jgi:hypothetical protein